MKYGWDGVRQVERKLPEGTGRDDGVELKRARWMAEVMGEYCGDDWSDGESVAEGGGDRNEEGREKSRRKDEWGLKKDEVAESWYLGLEEREVRKRRWSQWRDEIWKDGDGLSGEY